MDILSEIYNKLQNPVYEMAISDRCDLQKLLNKAIRMDDAQQFLNDIDRENFLYHINNFESDIFLIESKTREQILKQAAIIQIALNRMSDIYKTE